MDLNILWFILLGVLLAGYAILDGFDLGVGILQPSPRPTKSGACSINSIGPHLGRQRSLARHVRRRDVRRVPEVYATVFSGFYIAFMLVLFALILRAVSIEFRSKINSHRPGDGSGTSASSSPACWRRSCSAWPSAPR